jgi:hypothetical protein
MDEAAVPHLGSRPGDGLKVHRVVRPDTAMDQGDALIDSEDQAHRIYGDGLILVRPDGYVGYTGPGGCAGLTAYLRQFFG